MHVAVHAFLYKFLLHFCMGASACVEVGTCGEKLLNRCYQDAILNVAESHK